MAQPPARDTTARRHRTQGAEPPMSRTKTVLRSLLAIGAAGAVAAFGTFSAFSSTTSNPSNQIAAGTVALGDNDLGAAMYNVAGAKPGDVVEKCIKVSYTGTLDADVKLYVADTVGPLGQYLDLTVTPGTQATSTFPDCAGFTADGAPIYSGTLAGFRSAHNAWANGLAYNPGGATKWAQNDSRVFRVRLTVQDNRSEEHTSELQSRQYLV